MFGCQPTNYNYPRRRERKRFSNKPKYYRNPRFRTRKFRRKFKTKRPRFIKTKRYQ